jgi:hypothetical protein
VNGHQIDNVAYFTPSGGGLSLVQRQIHRMQYISANRVPDGREKAEIAVYDPFEACGAPERSATTV